jgi:branched-chain amino acid aminotransferase
MSLKTKLQNNTNKKKTSVMWSNGSFKKGTNTISSLNSILHYAGPAVWEGIRSYKQAKGNTEIWKLEEHIERLYNSAKILNIKIIYDKATLITACRELVKANGNGDQYIRPIIYAAEGADKVRFCDRTFNVDIYSFPVPKMKNAEKGLKMGISTQVRGFPQFNMQAKTTQNYSFVYSCGEEAARNKVDDVFLKDNNGHLVETSVANFYVIYRNTALTPPNDGSILPGITRSIVSEVILDTNIFYQHKLSPLTLVEYKITPALLYTADEIFLCGTYAEIIPVVEVDGRVIGNGKIGKVTKLIKEQYNQMVRGRCDEKY